MRMALRKQGISISRGRMRRTRYRGQAKTHLQHLATAAAINLLGIVDWLDEKIRSKTRVSHFVRLQLVV